MSFCFVRISGGVLRTELHGSRCERTHPNIQIFQKKVDSWIEDLHPESTFSFALNFDELLADVVTSPRWNGELLLWTLRALVSKRYSGAIAYGHERTLR